MSSTNKTSHYNLSQYTNNDKPTYLVDYNTDMSNIDTGIYNAKNEADTNATNIGTLSSLTTTAKTSLVSAINEVDGNADTANSNIGTLSSLTTSAKTDVVSAINEVDSEADTNTTNIGTLSNLSTTDKTNLVSAINEVDSNADTANTNIGTLSSLTTTNKANLVEATNEVKANVDNFNLTSVTTYGKNDFTSLTGVSALSAETSVAVATNSDGSLCKIYGAIYPSGNATGASFSGTIQTSLRPSTAITIYPGAIIRRGAANTEVVRAGTIQIATNGAVTIFGTVVSGADFGFYLMPCLYYVKDFGDVAPTS